LVKAYAGSTVIAGAPANAGKVESCLGAGEVIPRRLSREFKKFIFSAALSLLFP
jgi:hypothetical protein